MLSSSLALILALVSIAIADPIHVPLRRRNSNAFSTSRIAAQADRVRGRYGYRRPSTALGRRAGQTVGIQTINQASIHFWFLLPSRTMHRKSQCHRHYYGLRAKRAIPVA